MKNVKISVLIPVYNAEETLKECLISILNQTYENYEIIVVDNNSTDKTKKIIGEFIGGNAKIKYIFEEKRGRGRARNAGIKYATGEIITMIDADCIAQENWISEIIKPILEHGEQVIMGGEKDVINSFWTKNIQIANQNLVKKNLKGNHVGHLDTKNFAIRADLIKKMMFDENIGNMEDFELYLRLKKDKKIFFLPNLNVEHKHKESFEKWFELQIDRGYWVYRIYQKHKNEKDSKKEPMFKNFSIINWIKFPFWTIVQFIKKPVGEASFLIISDLGWKIGIIKGLILQ